MVTATFYLPQEIILLQQPYVGKRKGVVLQPNVVCSSLVWKTVDSHSVQLYKGGYDTIRGRQLYFSSTMNTGQYHH